MEFTEMNIATKVETEALQRIKMTYEEYLELADQTQMGRITARFSIKPG
jgi:hypothetical protein